jgi:spermidine synthase
MVLEVVWTRLLSLMIGSSVYAFAWMLVAFLFGHALGAGLGSLAVRRIPPLLRRSTGGAPDPSPRFFLSILGGGLLLAALLAAGTHAAWPRLPFWFVHLYASLGASPDDVPWVQGIIALTIMAPATVGLGMLFPLAIAAVKVDSRFLARDVSAVYVANTMGAAFGAILAGFHVLPRLGIQGSLVAAALILSASAGVAWLGASRSPQGKLRGLGAATLCAATTVVLRPSLDPLLMSAGMYQYVNRLPDFTDEAVRNHAISDARLLYWAEGTTSFVTVARSLGSGTVWLANNGKIDASTGLDMPTQVLIGHLPFIYRREARRALVVGLASGISAGSVTLQPALEHIDVLEIEPAILTAARYFDPWSHAPLDDPRVRVLANDARNHLELVDGAYDIIINEPSNPWITGVSNLFTEEYLKLGRSRLAPGGAFLQWVQLYGMSTDDVKRLIRTFQSVFPHALAFSTVEDADLILLGSRAPLEAWPDDLAHHLGRAAIAEDLARVGVREPMDLLTLLVMDEPTLRTFAGTGPLNTDDNVAIEFSAPRTLLRSTQEQNAMAILESQSGPWPIFRDRIRTDDDRVVFLTQLGEAYERRSRWVDASVAYEEAVRRGGTSGGLEERLDRVTEAFKAELLEARRLEAEGRK